MTLGTGIRRRGEPFPANRERMNTTIRKASGATQSKEVVDRRQIHEFNIQATTPIGVLPCTRTAPTLYQFLKFATTIPTTLESLTKICSTPTRHQATTPPIVPIRARTKKKVVMNLVQAMALALKPPLRTLAREEAPGAEQPTRPVPQLHPFPFQLCRR